MVAKLWKRTTSGSRAHSDATMSVDGHSTAEPMPVKSPVTRRMKRQHTVLSLLMWSPTAHAAKPRSHPYLRYGGSHARTPSHTVTSPAIRFWLVDICARMNATPALAPLVASMPTYPVDVAERQPTPLATKETSFALTASVYARHSSTVDGTSAGSVVALAKRRQPRDESTSGTPTRTTSPSTYVCKCAAANSSAVVTLVSSYATRVHVPHVPRLSLTKSAVPAAGRFFNLLNLAGLGRPNVGFLAEGPARVATRLSNTNATQRTRRVQSAPT